LGAAVVAGIALVLFPGWRCPGHPATHIFLGESVLANLHQLPNIVADLLRAFR